MTISFKQKKLSSCKVVCTFIESFNPANIKKKKFHLEGLKIYFKGSNLQTSIRKIQNIF